MLKEPLAGNRRLPLIIAVLCIGVVALSVLFINQLPAELQVGGVVVDAPSSTSQPELLAIVIALHPSLAAAYQTTLETVSRVRLQLTPEPAPLVETYVTYTLDEATGNFVPDPTIIEPGRLRRYPLR